MPVSDLYLEKQPADARARELWLQHAAGLIIFEDARQYAIDRIDNTVKDNVRAEVIHGINNAIYGLMMIFDGVSGRLENEGFTVNLETKVTLKQKTENHETSIVDEVSLAKSNGLCMGYHGWLKGDFGNDRVASKK